MPRAHSHPIAIVEMQKPRLIPPRPTPHRCGIALALDRAARVAPAAPPNHSVWPQVPQADFGNHAKRQWLAATASPYPRDSFLPLVIDAPPHARLHRHASQSTIPQTTSRRSQARTKRAAGQSLAETNANATDSGEVVPPASPPTQGQTPLQTLRRVLPAPPLRAQHCLQSGVLSRD